MNRRIAIISDNSIEYVKKIIEIWNNGDSVVLMDWRIPFPTIIKNIKLANAKFCYIEKKFASKIFEYPEIKFKVIEKTTDSCVVMKEIVDKYQDNYSTKEAVIFFSSGTTGPAKGIRLSHKAISQNADAIIDYLKMTPKDNLFITKTLAHSSTFVGELLPALKLKCKLVVVPTIMSIRKVFNVLHNHDITMLGVNPTLLQLYGEVAIKHHVEFHSLRVISCSGSNLSKECHSNIKRIFPNTKILNVYGLSELGPRVAAQRYDDYRWTEGSVGVAIKGVKIKVVSCEGKEVKDGEKGCIHVKSEYKMMGYLEGKSARKSYYQGWFNTGDIGYVKNGELFVTGREDDMIICGSHNVYPASVEEAILKHKNIRECVVFGYPDKLFGEKVICFYVTNDSEIKESELREFVNKSLAEYEVPTEFLTVQVLPLTENGKISRRLAQKLYGKLKEEYM